MSDQWVRMYHPDLLDEDGNRVYAPAMKEAYDVEWKAKGWKTEGEDFQRAEDAGATPIDRSMELEEAAAKATPPKVPASKGSGS